MLKTIVPALDDIDLVSFLDERRLTNPNWNSLTDRRGRQVKQKLEGAFHNKCAYCEDNQGATVDHFWPQSASYADGSNARWHYENFILSCTGCQSAKLAQLPKNDADVWMVNPRTDDPILYLYIDYQTGAIASSGPDAATRGQLTIERLKLDERGEKFKMNDARRRKFLDVFHYIKMAVDFHAADLPKSQAAWELLCDHLTPANPYLAIIRQFLLDTPPGLVPLLESLRQIHPEFDNLIEVWCLPKPENA
jgi:uncharacterized protein (TIGR02646 family)